MRIFINQTNRVYTDPVMNISVTPNVAITDATVTCNVYDSNDALITGSNISLIHTSGGVYAGELPELALTVNTNYQIEVSVVKDAKRIWYTKQPIKAIINK